MTTNTAPADDLVTEEMIDTALAAAEDFIAPRSCMKAALRAVAPLIAERAIAAYKKDFMHAPWRTETKP